ncbi:MAG TPA: hypothetical protein VFC84_12725 [Desulfosporosinus sp.]|nr:hypothetical protein [Desulfosporosinus sp.]
MDDIERNSTVRPIQPVRKIGARVYDRQRRELTYPNNRNYGQQFKKHKKEIITPTEHLTDDLSTPEEIEQDLSDYKSDLRTRLTFDRAQILPEGSSSD